ncbi:MULTISPECIES: hypothetical protein [unclassified Sphingobium]|uniref:hypothetical protein n=1 Tax=unclassified Sphingobium TaxID=2611147 RepID=UPI000D15EEF7|nr:MULTISPECIES: hypothetical protein [unclassified Sphingobium]MBG6118550.1 hypothetical protein [Sphingobium sp. JAI105]PSO10130.1 hypothetical protein C7E20_18850 [Sphingobium sp. AEW4]TWC98769.1 hypothetical protein FB595_12619 [Sphingobium sp. AEW010]TWD18359.1 hypothetical protein FB596_12719 [Sphingobium sp. AEW013]TWD20997.1 hypothetical protein FB594_12719 [Sphingobium sp. AEW001]
MIRYVSNPLSRVVASTKRVCAKVTPSRHKAPWKRRAAFDCEHGLWKGSDFPIPPEIVMPITETMAVHDGQAVIYHEVREDDSESRFVVRMVFAA